MNRIVLDNQHVKQFYSLRMNFFALNVVIFCDFCHVVTFVSYEAKNA